MRTVRCPICRKETSWENNPFRPFCSERCRTRDLGNWASGRYAVPGEEVSQQDDFREELSTDETKKKD